MSKYYKPVWEGPIEGYVVNFLSRNYWRVEASMERDDALQEARIVFLRIAKRYPKLTEAKHFMALFKSSLSRHFHDLSTADSRMRALFVPLGRSFRDEDGDEITLQEPMGDHENDGALSIMLRQAPAEVLTVLSIFLSAPQELLELALSSSWHPESPKGCAKLNRLCGFPSDYNALGAVRDYFQTAH